MVKVQLAVYDLSNGMAAQLSQAILGQRIDGIWHTGVVVYGREYFFGGGIQNVPVGSFTTMNGLRPCQMLELGETGKTQAELESYLRNINHQYTQATYDLINHNCNNFSNTVALFLLGQGIPEHIVDLPRIVFSTPGGMMLRPMIESMQNGISQHGGGGMDPFSGGGGGGVGGGTNPLASLSTINNSSTYNSSTTTTISNSTPTSPPAKVTTNTTIRTFSSIPEEKPFVSADIDAKTLNALCNKIITHCVPPPQGSDKDENQALLSEGESADLRGTIEALSDAKLSIFPHKTFATLGFVIKTCRSLQMASLFIMRLLALHLHQRDPIECRLESEEYGACREAAHHLLQLVKAGENGFSSSASLVMGICTLANLVSSTAGCDLLFHPAEQTAEPEERKKSLAEAESRVNELVDACTWGLSHAKAEVRQMSATLAYNVALAYTKGRDSARTETIVITQDIKSLPWYSLHHPPASSSGDVQEAKQDDDDLHHHIVQILCAVLETVGDETDPVSLGRKLHTAYFVSVAGGEQACELVTALGFGENVSAVKNRHQTLSAMDRLRLGNFEMLLGHE